jgi:ADP-ribose pyrophosphatase
MSNDEKVDLIERRTAFQGYFKVETYRYRHTTYRGGMSEIVEREVFERGPVAAVLPYDPVRDEVVLIRQMRSGALAAGLHPWLWETVAGIVEPGESVEDLVRREAQEEAGLQLGELIRMHEFLVSPGGASEVCTCFLGRADLAGAGGIFGLASEGEDILVRPFAWNDALAMLERGELGSAIGTIALQWLALHREEVRRKWR